MSHSARRISIGYTDRKTADLPLAVWPCAQSTGQCQRRGRYVSESNRHPAKMLPAIARRVIATYSDPGDLVVDPMCGIGTTPVEAIHLGRHAIGVELEPRWAKLARANVERASDQGAHLRAQIIGGDASQLPRLLTTRAQRLLAQVVHESDDLAHTAYGHVDLILTSPPYGCGIAEVSKEALARRSGTIRSEDTYNYSPDLRNLGHARGGDYLEAMAEVYGACAAVSSRVGSSCS